MTRTRWAVTLLGILMALVSYSSQAAAARPNNIFILADDLGYGDLSCYGQQKFKTPNIDRIASEGMKFTAHYSGHNVCAPSRCALMTGKHPGHGYIRENRGGMGADGEGQEPVPSGELKLPLTLKQLGYTLIVFTSDNGPLYDELGGTDTEFFNSAGDFRGRKGSYYEGGFRVPCVVRWPGKIRAGSTSTRVTGFEDWLPTLLELMGEKSATPTGIDGVSFAPTLLGKKQDARPFLHRESPGYTGQQCVRVGDGKLVRQNLHPGAQQQNPAAPTTELFDLAKDPREATDVVARHPDVVRKLSALADGQHMPSKLRPIRVPDAKE